jgi:hypothetical protein
MDAVDESQWSITSSGPPFTQTCSYCRVYKRCYSRKAGFDSWADPFSPSNICNTCLDRFRKQRLEAERVEEAARQSSARAEGERKATQILHSAQGKERAEENRAKAQQAALIERRTAKELGMR